MKANQLKFLFVIGIAFSFSFSFWQKEQVRRDEVYKNVSIVQEDKETIFSPGNNRIKLDKLKFSVLFYNKKYDAEKQAFYATQIAAFTDKKELDKIREGKLKSELPCFEPGSGMAPDISGRYESLIFNNAGHHYLMYEDEASKRVTLIGYRGDFLKLAFEINTLYLDEIDAKMEDTKLSEFYLAILIDRNLNGKIDKGELTKVTVELPENKSL